MPTPTDEPTAKPSTPAESELSPDEINATPPPSDEQILVQVDPAPSAPKVEPRQDEGKTPNNNDGEVIEIFDEE